MRVDLVYSLNHYLDHMLPIWQALPDDMKGEVHDREHPVRPPLRNRIALVGGWQDVQTLRPNHRMIYVEHGSGQTYAGDVKSALQPGYSGSGGFRHGGVEMFIAPNDVVAFRWQTAPAYAVGCPKMDQYVNGEQPAENAVCFAWHWESLISPEARTAWWHYASQLPDVVAFYKQQGFTVYGHAHPRWDGSLDTAMEDFGLTVLNSDREVFEKAEILFVDNSSIGMEFMSLGRPVVWLNAPWYRKSVNHGGRFWDWTQGIPSVDGADELLGMNLWDVLAFNYMSGSQEAQRRHVDAVYKYHDGTSAQRAADFIAQRYADK